MLWRKEKGTGLTSRGRDDTPGSFKLTADGQRELDAHVSGSRHDGRDGSFGAAIVRPRSGSNVLRRRNLCPKWSAKGMTRLSPYPCGGQINVQGCFEHGSVGPF